MKLLYKLKSLFKSAELPIITGTCHCCGECCRNVILFSKFDMPIKNLRSFKRLVKQEPCYSMFEPHHKDPDHGYYYFTCTNLGKDNLCTIYAKRPSFCALFPEPKMILASGELLSCCGYQVTTKTGFSTILEKEINSNNKTNQLNDHHIVTPNSLLKND